MLVFVDKVMDYPIVTNIDDEGTVCVARKGRAMRNSPTDCFVNTINHVAVAIGCSAFLRKVRRCSTPQANAADVLAKSDFASFRQLIPNAEVFPREVPRTVRTWI